MRKISIVLTLLLVFTISAYGREHDNLANAPLTMGSLAPKGLYWTMGYNVVKGVKTYNTHGDKVNNGFNQDQWAITNILIWVPGFKILGADYGAKFVLSLVDNNVATGAGATYSKKRGTGIIDPVLTPIALGWHFPRFDITAEVAVYMPFGYYSQSNLSVGQDHWTFAPKLGGTVYFDSERTWTLSTMLAYEANIDNIQKDIRQGDQMTLQYGLAKRFGAFQIGLSGYCSWKMKSDSGSGVAPQDRGTLDRIYALGPEMNYRVQPLKTTIGMKYLQEFEARARAQTGIFRVSLAWKF